MSKEPMDVKENDSEVEAILLSVCNDLDAIGDAMFRASGAESYTERCHNHDARMLIYGLTNKCRIEKKRYEQWRAEIHSKR